MRTACSGGKLGRKKMPKAFIQIAIVVVILFFMLGIASIIFK